MRDYAIVIGIEHYKAQVLKQLTGASNDAQDFYNWVTSPAGGCVENSNCRLLLSEEGLTKLFIDQIEESLVELIELAENNEDRRRFYFYFSGHGLGVSLDEVSLLVTNWEERLAHRGISSKKCHDSILESGIFSEVFFFLDCCRSKLINLKPQGGLLWTPGIHPDAKRTESLTVFATTHGDVAYEDDIEIDTEARRNGYFTRALIDGLNGEAASSTGEVTLARLKGHLKNKTELLALQNNRNQNVRFNSSYDSDETVIVKIENLEFADFDYNVIIEFTDEIHGPFIIEDKDLQEVGNWTKEKGPWKIKLSPGLNLLTDTSTRREMSIQINMNQKEIKNVKF